MTTTIDSKTDVYSRPNARFGADGTLEIRASAVGNCRRALWYDRQRSTRSPTRVPPRSP